LEISIFCDETLYNAAASFLSSIREERLRITTAESIVGMGIGKSKPSSKVHLPVPFAPALSSIMSTK
jgi:hypothetical protein